MEDNKCGCEDVECMDESVKDNPNETKENKPNEDNECGCGDTEYIEKSDKGPNGDNNGCGCGCEEKEGYELEENNECRCEKESSDASEGDDGCGCGCGSVEYPDQSAIGNPEKPKFIADDKSINEFEKYAHSMGIKAVGYTQLTPELLIKDKFIQYSNVIVLTMEMSKELIGTDPSDETQELNDAHYEKLGKLTYELSDYLREKGYATEVAHPYGGIVNFSPLAQKAGMGFIGQNGLLITPESGPGQKISAIFVSIANLPVKNGNEHVWIPDYCAKCGKCIKACPEKALIEKETCCGGKEIEFIQKLCIGCSQGCNYCIGACPFDEKGYEHVKNKFDKMNAKLMKKKNKKFEIKLWYKWAKQNSPLFADLVNGSTIAISMTGNDERMILLEKKNADLKVNITNLKELENHAADLMFLMNEKDMGKLLEEDNAAKFIEYLSSGKVQIYAVINQSQLIDKGYNAFLDKLGFRLGGGGCC